VESVPKAPCYCRNGRTLPARCSLSPPKRHPAPRPTPTLAQENPAGRAAENLHNQVFGGSSPYHVYSRVPVICLRPSESHGLVYPFLDPSNPDGKAPSFWHDRHPYNTVFHQN